MAEQAPSAQARGVETLSQLRALVKQSRGHIVVLTGAGVSTESGIPDYRSPASLARVAARRPVQGPEFVRSARLRQRYWARAVVGWERFRQAQPGASHRALAQLEQNGTVRALITQNVDRLHHAAGSLNVTELHGALADVMCLACGVIEPRDALQARIVAANPGWVVDDATAMAPDGDAELDDDQIAAFVVPECVACGGTLKPKVVFFGDNVPREVVERAYDEVERAKLLLVAGTSLTVFSGYRFLRRAAELRIAIAIVNRGPVRGEEHALLKLEESTGETLQALTHG